MKINILAVVLAVVAVLKVNGIVTWPWWAILAPVYIPVAIVGLVLVVAVVISLFVDDNNA